MSNERVTAEQIAGKAAKHHTDLNIFAVIVSILEGGHIYTSSGMSMAARIIRLCQEEEHRQLQAYDREIRKVKP